MNTLSKILLTIAAAVTVGSGAAMADTVVRRIDHPNGPPTFVTVPEEYRSPTIGVYRDGYVVEGPVVEEVVVESAPGKTDSLGRTLIPIHRGRGEVIYVPIGR